MFDQIDQKIINKLKQVDKLTLADLAKLINEPKSSLYYKLQNLESLGIVTRSQVTERKIYFSLKSRVELNHFIEGLSHGLEELLLDLEPQKKRLKLVFVDSYPMGDKYLKLLNEKFDVVRFPDSPLLISEELFLLRVKDAEVIVMDFSIYLSEEILKQCKNLKVIISPTISRRSVDEEATKRLGIKFLTLDPNRNFKRSARREFMLVALFSLIRPIHMIKDDVKIGKFDHRYFYAEEIQGKRIGVVGTKNSGKDVVPVLRALGAEVKVVNPDNPYGDPSEVGLSKFSDLKEIFLECDIVVFAEEYKFRLNLSNILDENSSVRYIACLSSSVDWDFSLLRKLIIKEKIKGLYFDFVPLDFYMKRTSAIVDNYEKVMNFPNVIFTPDLAFYTKESIERNNEQLFEILNSI